MTVATLLVGGGYSPDAQGGRGREAGRNRVAPLTPAGTVQPWKIGVRTDVGGDVRLALESGPVHFGEVLSGEPKEVPGGIRARVYAEGEWSLLLVPRVPLRAIDGAGFLARSSRLAWRSAESTGYEPFVDGHPTVVASGAATGPAGTLVVIDLRMALDEQDDLGWYECRLDLTLDSGPARGLSH